MKSPVRFRLELQLLLAVFMVGTFAVSPQVLLAKDASGGAKRLLGYYPEWSKYNDPPFGYSADQIPYD